MDISNEADAHNRLLEQMGVDMDSVRGTLGGAVGKFKEVMAHKGNRNMAYTVGGIVTFFMLIYFFTHNKG